MSGVLDRMVRRALGALPAIEPVLTPRFAPVRNALGEALPRTETVQELEAAGRPAHREAQSEARRPIVPSRTRTTEARRGPEPEQNAEIPSRSLRAEAKAMPAVQPVEARAQAERRASAAHRGVRGADSDSSPVRQEEADTRRGRVAQPVAWLREASVPAKNAMEESASTAAPAKADEKETRAEEATQPPLRRVEARTWRADQRGVREGNRQAPPAQQAAEEKTEIHISIGSVELRAARVEPRPQSAPFRPRVTLDDFLHRKPEGRS